MNLPIVPADSSDERQESIVVGAAVALALVVGLGFGAAKIGLLDKFFGDADVTKVAAPVFAWVHTEAGGDPQRVLLSGFVVDEKQSKALEASVKKAFPKSEVKNAVRIDVPKPGVKKPAKPGTGTVRLSFAADAVNEAWPRARFGQVKRFEVVWKEEQLTVRGALFAPESKAGLEKAFGALNKKNQGVLQVRDVVRPAVPVEELQNQIDRHRRPRRRLRQRRRPRRRRRHHRRHRLVGRSALEEPRGPRRVDLRRQRRPRRLAEAGRDLEGRSRRWWR